MHGKEWREGEEEKGGERKTTTDRERVKIGEKKENRYEEGKKERKRKSQNT